MFVSAQALVEGRSIAIIRAMKSNSPLGVDMRGCQVGSRDIQIINLYHP